MSFKITRKLEPLPSYQALCALAGQHHVTLTGNERAGSFSGRGVKGDYEIGEAGIHGTVVAHGVKGQFSLGNGQATVTVVEKPFWVPESLLKLKITEGLDALGHELA